MNIILLCIIHYVVVLPNSLRCFASQLVTLGSCRITAFDKEQPV